MSFALFDFDPDFDKLVESALNNSQKLEKLGKLLGANALPPYIQRFILRTSTNIDKSISFQKSASISNYKDMTIEEKGAISRKKGLMGSSQANQSGDAVHFFKIFTNNEGRGRLFYKFDGSIQFIKNLK